MLLCMIILYSESIELEVPVWYFTLTQCRNYTEKIYIIFFSKEFSNENHLLDMSLKKILKLWLCSFFSVLSKSDCTAMPKCFTKLLNPFFALNCFFAKFDVQKWKCWTFEFRKFGQKCLTTTFLYHSFYFQ